MNIIWKGSPNKDGNRKPITTIVMHWFGIGTLESANNRFQNPASQVSAHYGISNKTIWQWVTENEVAYHAGNYSMNQRSIGIEHDATSQDDANPHNASEDTYKTSAELIREIAKRYDIPLDTEHVIGHNDVVSTQCPGTLDIDRIIAMAKEAEEACVKLSEDMPSFVEDEYDLKSKEWYDKYWNLGEFISDSINAHDELEALEEKHKDLEKKSKSQDAVIVSQIEQLKGKDIQVETLQKSNSELTAQISVMGQQVRDAVKEKNDSIEDKRIAEEALEAAESNLNEMQLEVDKLNNKLSQGLKGYSKWELFKAWLLGI